MKNNILTQIKEKKNIFLEELKQCAVSGFPTYIYGSGEGARNVERRGETIGFTFDGRVVDKEYYNPAEKNCERIDDVVKKGKINIVVAHRGFSKSKIVPYKKNIGILIDRDCFSGNYEADPEMMTYEYVCQHQGKLERTIEALADDRSKECLYAYINQKISMDYKYLQSLKSDEQYFDSDIININSDEAFVDVGAYIGDTVQAFLNTLKRKGIKSYEAIYSFEPDRNNFKQLESLHIEKFYPFNIATSDYEGEVSFSSVGKGSSSGITEGGTKSQLICTAKLDDCLLGKRVTFIKMDVEGYELESLKGAEKIIKTQKPKLAICIYHKKNDLWEIWDYIYSIVPEYNFYIRAYEETATELVLYAVV